MVGDGVQAVEGAGELSRHCCYRIGVVGQVGREQLCIVKTAPPTKSRTYAPLEFRAEDGVLPPLSVGEMTLRLYAALNYSQNSARDLRCALNGA